MKNQKTKRNMIKNSAKSWPIRTYLLISNSFVIISDSHSNNINN